MTVPHVGLRPIGSDRSAELLAGVVDADPTYDFVGETLLPGAPLDLDERLVLGRGAEVFGRAVASLRGLEAQRSIGAVWPQDAEAVVGATVLVAPRVGPFVLAALVRIVAVVDEPDRWGFAYGTLPGHPERGEECFVVERDADGVVVMHVAARSRPSVPGGRLLVPLTVPLQRRYARRYLAAIARTSS